MPRTRAWLFSIVVPFACSGSSSAPPDDPCAAIDHCPLSVNTLLLCGERTDAGPPCTDTLRAWTTCWSQVCDNDAYPYADPDAGEEAPCATEARTYQACKQNR